MMEFERHTRFDDGIVIRADCTEPWVPEWVVSMTGQVPLVVTDPPYGNIVSETWDKVDVSAAEFANWLANFTKMWADVALLGGGAFYVWGGIGRPNFRPFLHYITMVESDGVLELANLITWSKKRAYGVAHNYLFTREELAYFVKGDIKKPRRFNVPLLDEKRGYAGYNAKYPAKSEFYRRTNVWTDITEILRGKIHPTQKPERLMEIPILTHTNPGEWVIDPFGGSGTTAVACRNTGRKFVIIENDPQHYRTTVERLAR